MSRRNSETSTSAAQAEVTGQRHPALKRLERLVGTWEMSGRTLGAQEDNIVGQVTIAWLPGGHFLEQRGEMSFLGHKGESLEVVGYDPVTDIFPATVYSSMSGDTLRYVWDVQGDVVIHWTAGAKYTGKFSDGGKRLVGGWRPDAGTPATGGNSYDVTMWRVEQAQ